MWELLRWILESCSLERGNANKDNSNIRATSRKSNKKTRKNALLPTFRRCYVKFHHFFCYRFSEIGLLIQVHNFRNIL
jgi:hypothetical protein